MKPENARSKNVQLSVDTKKLEMKEFKALWNRINSKSVGGIINLFTPKCIVDGCNSEREEGSSYCHFHENSAAYKYYKSHSNSKSSYNGTSSNYNSSSNSSDSYSSSKSKSSYDDGSTTYNSSSSTKKSYSYDSDNDDDPYDASSYSDAEDFYYDNCDDFWDYEEAEDYYNEYGEE